MSISPTNADSETVEGFGAEWKRFHKRANDSSAQFIAAIRVCLKSAPDA